MSFYATMSDADLIARSRAALGLAHRAPFAEWSTDHRGHSAVVNHTSAWAGHSQEVLEIDRELRRRGLGAPGCDCPPGAHDRRTT